MLPKKTTAITILGLLLAAAQCPVASAQQAPDTAKNGAAPAPSEARPVVRPKSFDVSAMDKSVNPCDDFYEYACGAWRRNNPIPSDQARWGRFNELAEYNRQVLHQILEKASANDPQRGPVTQKIGDFYASCMDETAVNAKGAAPLNPLLLRIAAIATRSQLMETIAALQSQGVGVLFEFGAQPDFHNASQMIATIEQAGLGLPDRDYYLNQDAKSIETRKKYTQYLENMFVLLGDSRDAAGKETQAVLNIETKLAEASFDRVKMRDPKNSDHKMKLAQLAALAPNFEFQKFFLATHAPAFSEVNVIPPDFFQKVNTTLDAAPLDDWKSYLRARALRPAAPLLSEPFVRENFNFYGRYLNGQKELQARWKRCVVSTDQLLGEALGQPYVEETFGSDGKARMLKMVDALEKALGQDIQTLSWMSEETKKQAIAKLSAITNKIGYPDKWKDYGTVSIQRGDLLGNALRARQFESQRDLAKIGKPVDKSEWGMSPPTVNAYYNPLENNINFPAGILQPPFFGKSEDDAVNFGAIGVVIGHELTHGFDDQGSKFGPEGNLRDWWTPTDKSEFEKRTTCLADEYSSFVPVDDVHLNGRLTLGENTADNGGVTIALLALRGAVLSGAKSEAAGQLTDGFTAEQRFFLSFAQIWCENRTPESSRLLVKTDPHSPGRYRVIGALQNNSEFAKAFGCKEGHKMVSPKVCRVW